MARGVVGDVECLVTVRAPRSEESSCSLGRFSGILGDDKDSEGRRLPRKGFEDLIKKSVKHFVYDYNVQLELKNAKLFLCKHIT